MYVRRNSLALALCLLACAASARAQAPHVIQFFMPDRSHPAREIRFTLTRDDGRVETLFTDSKGKFDLTGSLSQESSYTVTAYGDGRTYETTTTNFRIVAGGGVTYVPVFLRPLKGVPVPPANVVDLSEFDLGVPAAARAAYDAGMEAAGKGRLAEAVESLKRAVSLHPQYLRALNDLGVLYLKSNRLDEAADSFSRAIKINSRFPHARLNLGAVLNRQGRHEEAVALLETLFRDSPNLEGARVTYADALYGVGRLGEARKLLAAALDSEGLDRAARGELHYKLGRVLSREDKVAEAVKELRRAVELQPDAANAHLLLGGGLLQLKRPEEAEKSLLRAYELGGAGVGHAQLLLGQLYLEQNKFEPALRAFEQYLKDVPQSPNAAQITALTVKIKNRLRGK
ncbi:MAG: tetratricopeptide repeat protein [Pyrinomonadaceae bacterium]